MIIWINGAFGAGKTTCAFELHRRLPNSFVYDPENFGYFLNTNVPKTIRESDFQNFPQWRLFNYEILKLLSQKYHGTIIVPMTITNKQYYDEVIGRLTKEGIHIKHFIIYAQKETLVKRLNKRLEFGESWGKQRIGMCINAFNQDICEQKIHTDDMSVDSVVSTIADLANIVLPADNRSALKKWFDRILTVLRHVRK
ncbi:tunicamycin resistance protein [Paenibacillaceae bacterium]|nr:tunicamycin resistance protein [Paenibacillaceae bacterium]